MWPFVAFAVLYPLVDPVATWLTTQAGQTPGTPGRFAVAVNVGLYLAGLVTLALHAFLR